MSASYYANGLVDALAGAGLPTITYAPDGEGRISTVSGGTQNPVTNTAYSTPFGLPTGVTLGSGDSDAFAYDPNTGRMTSYTFTVKSKTDSGALTWNDNGTLYKLAITDQLNSTNSQTCTSTYDDLIRLASFNCGSVWSQSFTADPFGNLTKSGTITFDPSYVTSGGANNNQVTKVGSVTPGYDKNGNLTSDGINSYSWDSDGNSVSIGNNVVGTVGLTFDALDRMVEQAGVNSYTQIVYGPGGGKLALMNAQTLLEGFVPLPAGDTAVYTGGPTLSYYRHGDWMGSSRLASTPTQTVYYDGAYAPYGENYAETGTTDRNFTGQNQDTISSGSYPLYDFLYREHHPVWGRWVSPDPAGLGAVDPTNPQSWNRYAYVTNNPLGLTDPLGLGGATAACAEFAFDAEIGGPDCAPWGGGFGGGSGGWIPPDMCFDEPFPDPNCGMPPGLPGGGVWGGGVWGGGGGGPVSGLPTGGSGPGIPGNGYSPADVLDWPWWSLPSGGVITSTVWACGLEPWCWGPGAVGAVGGLAIWDAIGVYHLGQAYGHWLPKAKPVPTTQSTSQAKSTGSSLIDCLNQYARDLQACASQYPAGPARQQCFAKAKITLEFCKGNIPGPVQ